MDTPNFGKPTYRCLVLKFWCVGMLQAPCEDYLGGVWGWDSAWNSHESVLGS